jgi:hypothetical protein
VASTPSGTVLTTVIDPPHDPIAARITSPSAGPLGIIETSTTTPPPDGFGFAGRQVHLEAPPATPTDPVVLAFTIDSALLAAPTPWSDLEVFRDGNRVEPCSGSPWRAVPDPCVAGRLPAGANEVKVTVVSSTSGEWNFGTATGPPTVDRCLGGTTLMLQDTPGRPARRRFLVRSNDTPQLVLGDGADIPGLIAQGGSLTVVAIGGDGFETTYPLAAEGWRPLRRRNPGYGVRYRDKAGPITTVVFKAGQLLEVTGTGPQLVQSLNSEPDMVEVELRLGGYRYRLAFGDGAPHQFRANKRLLRRWATRPRECSFAGSVPAPAASAR